MEIQDRIQNSMRPFLEHEEQIRRMTEISDALKGNLPSAATLSPGMDVIAKIEENDAVKHLEEYTSAITAAETLYANTPSTAEILGNAVMKFGNYFANYQINSGIYDAVSAFEQKMYAFGSTFQKIIDNTSSALMSAFESPMMQWLQSFDFTPVWSFLENLEFEGDYLDKYKELNGAYLTAMYECKWFPYAGWSVDIRIFSAVSDIISKSRGASNRREKRIDEVIFAYYTKNEIKSIKRTWRNSDLEPHIKKILGQAIEAHLRGEYVLTITCLSTMWEGLIHKRLNVTERLSSRKTKEGFKELISENDFAPIFSDFYEKFIVCDCNSPEEVIDGVPNRNAVSHSKYKKYPNKKASLNAILLTDFIIGLEPKEMN